MKKMFKKIASAVKKCRRWIDKQIIWYFNRRVLDAIDNGATYEEVCNIVEEELNR